MYANYVALKSKSKAAVKKIAASGDIPEHFVLEKKRYDANTGEEGTSLTKEVSLEALEVDKNHLTREKVDIESQLTEIEALITDIKAL